jgi:hypothetical protein
LFACALLVIGILLATVTGTLLISRYDVYRVGPSSMTNTIHRDDRLIIKRGSDVERGDVVLFAAPSWNAGPDLTFVKRVVAVGGDTVTRCDPLGPFRSTVDRSPRTTCAPIRPQVRRTKPGSRSPRRCHKAGCSRWVTGAPTREMPAP